MKAFRAWALMLAAVLAGCGDGSIQSPDFTTQLVSLRVVVDNPNPALGETIHFQAIGTFTAPPGSANETFEEVIADANWTSSNDNVVSVDGDGNGSTNAQGTATVTGESNGISGGTTIVVGAARLTSLVIEPPSASIPLGSMTTFFARGRYTDGVTRDLPPGTSVTWTPADTGIATLNPTTGVSTNADSYAIGGPVTIRATSPAPQGGTVSATASLTVTGATLESVDYVKPAGFDRAVDNLYTVFVGEVPFEIYGTFSDGTTQQLSGANFTVGWTSSAPAVINNPDGDEQFAALSLGSADITGEVTNPPGAVPDSATATVTVAPVNEFCVNEFIDPPAVVTTSASSTCAAPACTISQPDNIIDGDLDSFATLTVNLGLLMQSSLGVNVFDTTQARLVVGQQTGFVVSRPTSLLSLDLLGSLSIDTLLCAADGTCNVLESFTPESGNVGIDLLGLIGDDSVFLLSTTPLTVASEGANGLRLTYQAESLVALQSAVNVHSACAVAVPPAQ
ncbi:MAG: hypothetical protein WC809_05620 [Sinimarinibacterium sp.]|jgi:hypothetical protein